MEKDQVYGWLILLVSFAIIIGYLWLVFFPPWTGIDTLTLKLTGSAAIVFGFGIMAWIGYTLATTPPPKPIEEIEKELEKEISTQKEETSPQKEP